MKARKIDFYFYNLKNKLRLFSKNPRFIFFYIKRFLKYNSLHSFDSFIVSYPKSGRTWLQKMLIEGCKLQKGSNSSINDISNLKLINKDLPYILSTHAGSSWEEIVLNYIEIKRNDLESYNERKIIFLYRDPRDVLVSQYYHIKHRTGYKSFRKEDMIMNSNVGLQKIINFMNKWIDFADRNPSRIFKISYERLRVDTFLVVKNTFAFLDINIDDSNILKAIENCELKKMQNAESKNSNTPWNTTSDKVNLNNFQSRKGLIGEYKDFFSTDEISLIDSLIENQLCDLFDY